MSGATAKLKVSVTLAADVLALVDRDARRSGGTRSGVIEQWLRRASSAAVESAIDEATETYYRSLRGDDRSEDEAMARASSRAARRVAYDGVVRKRRARP